MLEIILNQLGYFKQPIVNKDYRPLYEQIKIERDQYATLLSETARQSRLKDEKISELTLFISENTGGKKETVLPKNFHEQNISKIKNEYTYPCRGFWQQDDKWKSFQMDLRLFCTPTAKTILDQASLFNGPTFTNDEKMKKIRDWVRKNIDRSATQDKDVFGVDEFYQYSWETLELKQSDCDDSGILIRDLAEAAGVPEDRLLVLACNSLSSGHLVCIYCRETDNEWVAIDAVYFATTDEVKNLPILKADNRYSEYWFAFNSTITYRHPVIQ